ncbi:G-protein-signaling modulator 2-like [Liolophura sinensis]|uniref:G-protein-signaling modulator 2-like n=1 Tax=Liolophura sinensis TaxID=3198878 RepID=UPI00315918CB
MEGTCMELALEGERLCKAGDCRTGVQFFEAAVRMGTDDLKTLSAIYSQLGNAYFYLQEYGKALEYHKHDLNLARTIGDKVGEAKASGNLGNTLKVLGKFDEAIVCCVRHLDISRELTDKVGEARALYNLGNVYHAKGKHAGKSGHQDPGEFPPEVKDCLQKAAEYYEENLELVRQLGDRAAQGRACGNLGNTYYLLGNFSQAIVYHEERLAIAKEFGDKSAERRAYSNLGNAHIFLGEFDVAAEHYKKTLQIAKQLGDRALEAQACYSLGNTFTLLRDYEQAIEYHMRHLMIARELSDRVGEGRACWSLGNAHTALCNHETALQFATKHLDISKEIGDQTGELTAQMNLADLKKMLGINCTVSSVEQDLSSFGSDRDSILSSPTNSEYDKTDAGVARRHNRVRRLSMENMELVKITPEKAAANAQAAGAKPKAAKLQKSVTIAGDGDHNGKLSRHNAPLERPRTADLTSKDQQRYTADMMDDDSFFELLSRFQSRRIDDQRCSVRVMDTKPNELQGNGAAKKTIMTSPGAEEFLDMVAGIQSSRIEDQRACPPRFPGLNSTQVVEEYLRKEKHDDPVPDDNFFEMLMRCQGSRLEEQRSSLPNQRSAPTVPDEDFFSLIQRVQSSRLESQRTNMPLKQANASSGTSGKKKKK